MLSVIAIIVSVIVSIFNLIILLIQRRRIDLLKELVFINDDKER